MEFFDVIKARYSHKARFDREQRVPREDLEQIVQAGMLAPSAMNRQSPEFVIIDEPEVLDKLAEWSDHKPLVTAPALIAVLSWPEMREQQGSTSEFLVADYAAATENIILAATAMGYAAGWLDSPFFDTALRERTSNLLGIPDDRLLVLMVPVGKPAEEGPRRGKKPFEQRASWNEYAIERDES